jgi:hypothetical protein
VLCMDVWMHVHGCMHMDACCALGSGLGAGSTAHGRASSVAGEQGCARNRVACWAPGSVPFELQAALISTEPPCLHAKPFTRRPLKPSPFTAGS